MAEGGVHIVAPQQPDHPAAEPDAFGVAGRAAHLAGRLGELVDPALGVRVGLGLRRLVAGLAVGGLGVAALGIGLGPAPERAESRLRTVQRS